MYFHICAVIWIRIGSVTDVYGNEGWVGIMKEKHQDYKEADLLYTSIYSTAFYFTVSTATTVGYGDYYGSTFNERLFLIFLQFTGICIYSLIQGLLD